MRVSSINTAALVLPAKRGGGKMALVIALVEWLGILLGFFPCGLLDPAWPRVKSVVGLLMAVVVLALCCAFTSSYLYYVSHGELWSGFTYMFAAMDKFFFSVLALTPYLVLVAWWAYHRGLARHLRALKDLVAEGPPLPVLSFVLRISVVWATFVADMIILCYWYADVGDYETYEPSANVVSLPFILTMHTFAICLVVSSFYVIEHKLSETNGEMKNMLSRKNPEENPPDPLARLRHFRTRLVYLRRMHRDLCHVSSVPLMANNIMKFTGFVFMLFYILAYVHVWRFDFALCTVSCLGNLAALFVLGFVADAVREKAEKPLRIISQAGPFDVESHLQAKFDREIYHIVELSKLPLTVEPIGLYVLSRSNIMTEPYPCEDLGKLRLTGHIRPFVPPCPDSERPDRG
ncbi:hypothetical protein C7M84_008041 [Penaeus vannamei]|uniref:Uncharacterized protein n=1 Tax=Penaeus vannamei TaxID=6689 RepID=A0A3R7M5L3_PENVA|nr:hypothetical protein C7M84_008041 [Penaeus vannamei]